METAPPIGQVVWHSLRDAPEPTKRQLRIILLTWAATLILQYLDSRGRHGPRVWAEIASVLLFTGGTLLLGVMHVLRGACAETIEDVQVKREGRREIRVLVFRQTLGPILFALPTMGVMAGAALAAGATVLMVRFFLGSSPIVIVLAGANVAVLIGAAYSVSNTARFLYESAVEQAAAAARAENEATVARLAALQAQMNPHFLFNALNTVASLVRTDPRSAESTVVNLSEVLRRTLERTGTTTGTVGEEVEYIKAYLAVEQQRFGDRLRVDWAIAPDVLDLAVPPMTLQPLVENAIKHGLSPRRAGGRIAVIAASDGARLRLVVEDDGEGLAARFQEATGLGNLRKRLETLYGTAAKLYLESRPVGARVIVEVPHRTGVVYARADR